MGDSILARHRAAANGYDSEPTLGHADPAHGAGTASRTVVDRRGDASIIDTLPDAEQLLARRAAIVKELAPLRALYGGQGYMGERSFKLDEARIATVVRTRLAAEGVKVTEPMVDAGTRTHPHYIAALEADVKQRARWIELEEQLNDVEWRLRVRASDSYLLGAEAKLQ